MQLLALFTFSEFSCSAVLVSGSHRTHLIFLVWSYRGKFNYTEFLIRTVCLMNMHFFEKVDLIMIFETMNSVIKKYRFAW